MNIRIYQMQPEDIPEVEVIERECFSAPWSESGFREALKSNRNIFLTASAEDVENKNRRIIGYIGMYTAADEGEITNVAVSETARRLGAGRKLVLEAVNAASRFDVSHIYLEVRVSNYPALYLYEKCGFRKCGVRKKFYSDPQEDAFVMVKSAGT